MGSTPEKYITDTQINSCTQIFSETVVTLCQMVETSQISINRFMDMEIVVYTMEYYSAINELNNDAGYHYSVNQPQKY